MVKKTSTIIKGLFWTLLSFFLTSCSKETIANRVDELEGNARIMIVPDIQHYTDNDANLGYLDAIADYYVSHKQCFAGCFQVGDVTNNNVSWQWENAYNHFFSKFPTGGEPYFCLGNHDYGDNGKSGTRTSNIPEYLYPVFDLQMTDCEYENHVRFLQIDTQAYAVLDLEFAPRNEAIAWANDVVAQYPAVKFIILTHVFTNKYGQIHDETDTNVYHGSSQKTYSMGGEDYINDSMEIFEKLINNHPNIIMVICGHTLIPDYIEVCSKRNSVGKDVYIVTVNYQHYTNGGNGYVGILDFMDMGFRIRSFSTVKQKYGSIDISFGN